MPRFSDRFATHALTFVSANDIAGLGDMTVTDGVVPGEEVVKIHIEIEVPVDGAVPLVSRTG